MSDDSKCLQTVTYLYQLFLPSPVFKFINNFEI